MKHKVYYIDDSANPRSIEANTAEMAAWQFVHQQPRADNSQITVEPQPSVPWRSSEIIHYRACDLVNAPAPTDEADPDLVLRVSCGPERTYTVSGSMESLRSLATKFLQQIEEFPNRPNPIETKTVYGVQLVPGDGSRFQCFLCFEADADVAQYWGRQRGLYRFWAEYGRCLVQLVLGAFACIGIWTLLRWVL